MVQSRRKSVVVRAAITIPVSNTVVLDKVRNTKNLAGTLYELIDKGARGETTTPSPANTGDLVTSILGLLEPGEDTDLLIAHLSALPSGEAMAEIKRWLVTGYRASEMPAATDEEVDISGLGMEI